MGDKKDWFHILSEKFQMKNMKKEQLFILLLVGLLLCVIVIPTDKKEKVHKNEEHSKSSISPKTEVQENYEEKMEQKLEDTLSYINGVGKVEVMITMKDSGESIIEKDVPETSSTVSETDKEGGTRTTIERTSNEETVYSKSEDGTNTPYVIKNLEPKIEGIVIIAEGGDDSSVVQNICDAVLALFPVEIHKIKVVKMNE